VATSVDGYREILGLDGLAREDGNGVAPKLPWGKS